MYDGVPMRAEFAFVLPDVTVTLQSHSAAVRNAHAGCYHEHIKNFGESGMTFGCVFLLRGFMLRRCVSLEIKFRACKFAIDSVPLKCSHDWL